MRRCWFGRIGMSLVGLATVGISAPWVIAQAQAPRAEAAKVQPTGPRHEESEEKEEPKLDPSLEWFRQDQLARAREQVESLEFLVVARKAQLREADLNLDAETSLRNDFDRLKKKGVASALGQKQVSLHFARARTLRAVAQSELIETEKRFEQARRLVAFLERPSSFGPAAMNFLAQAGPSLESRLSALERKVQTHDAQLGEARTQIQRLNLKVFGSGDQVSP